MVIPPHYPPLRDWVEGLTWANNFRRARRLAWDMDIDIGEDGVIDFPSGSMFWARPAALNPLLDLGLSFSDFPPEPLPLDGTLAHQIERLFLFSCEKAGLKWLKALNEEVAIPEQRRESIGFPADISAFIRRHSFELLKYQPN
jgi:lipopolysaccharide biosynthesis protein